MKIYCRGKATIRHRETGKLHDIECAELDWEVVGGDERQMGEEIHYEAIVDHPELGLLTWGIWEYPIGIENYKSMDASDHVVVHDFIYGLEHEDPGVEVWTDDSIPDDPFTIFMSSYHHTGDLLADFSDHRGSFLLNRMLFSQQITALEAYLGDTLIKEVMDDGVAMQRLLDNDTDLVHEKLSLGQIYKDSSLVKRKVHEHLSSILYHNLAKVDVIYNIALGIRILKEARDKDSLFKAVKLRHDCIHRNGFDKDGNDIGIFSKDFVQSTADIIKDFVVNIERTIRSRPGRTSNIGFF